MSQPTLSERERRFVDAYMGKAAGNATEAAKLAGYSKKTATVIGSRLLRKVHVKAAIQERQAKRFEEAEISGARVLEEMRRIAFSDIRQCFSAETGELLDPKRWPDGVASVIAGIDVETRRGDNPQTIAKIKRWDKLRALEMLAKHLGLLVERVDANLTVRGRVKVVHELRG